MELKNLHLCGEVNKDGKEKEDEDSEKVIKT